MLFLKTVILYFHSTDYSISFLVVLMVLTFFSSHRNTKGYLQPPLRYRLPQCQTVSASWYRYSGAASKITCCDFFSSLILFPLESPLGWDQMISDSLASRVLCHLTSNTTLQQLHHHPNPPRKTLHIHTAMASVLNLSCCNLHPFGKKQIKQETEKLYEYLNGHSAF